MTEQQIRKELAAAKRQLAALQRKKLPKMKTVRSAFNGVLVSIPVDTPWSCDPSSEAYWCN